MLSFLIRTPYSFNFKTSILISFKFLPKVKLSLCMSGNFFSPSYISATCDKKNLSNDAYSFKILSTRDDKPGHLMLAWSWSHNLQYSTNKLFLWENWSKRKHISSYSFSTSNFNWLILNDWQNALVIFDPTSFVIWQEQSVSNVFFFFFPTSTINDVF